MSVAGLGQQEENNSNTPIELQKVEEGTAVGHQRRQQQQQQHQPSPQSLSQLTPAQLPIQPQQTATNQEPRPTKKRRRTVISCTECHRRKQKCDRNLPCSNCMDRGKVDICRYESEATIINKRASFNSNSNTHTLTPSPFPSLDSHHDGYGYQAQQVGHVHSHSNAAIQQVSALGYARENGNNALGFVEKMQPQSYNGREWVVPTSATQHVENGIKERYKNLIRQLPSRPDIEHLVDVYFREINWHYAPLDRFAFDQHLQSWWNLPYAVVNKGPQELPADLRFFPALLFQVLALALQFQMPDQENPCDHLKYVKEMTLDDLANDYSDSGAAILGVLGKRHITLVTVQAGFCRTSFLKNGGSIIEAWHSLGSAVHDAQEIMLHKNVSERAHAPEKLDHLWHTEDRRRMWSILILWDSHMALVLGRPTTIDPCRDTATIFPIDVSPSLDRNVSPPIPRPHDDPPTTLTMAILNGEMAGILREILALDAFHRETSVDFSRVDHIHDKIQRQFDNLPRYFQTEDPDTSFDTEPSCYWLPESRPLFETFRGFATMCLHRPHVFTHARSRSEALRASIAVLRAQRDFFQYLEAKHYKMFNLVLSTFDAAVMAAAIFTICPSENAELLDCTLQHFTWAMERFETMSERNLMAKAALGVLQAIHSRFKLATQRQRSNSSSPPSGYSHTSNEQRASDSVSQSILTNPSPESSSITSSQATAAIATNNTLMSKNMRYTEYPQMLQKANESAYPPISTSISSVNTTPYTIVAPITEVHGTNSGWDDYPSTLQASQYDAAFNFNNIAPLQPMHDLLYNELVGMQDAQPAGIPTTNSNYHDHHMPWQFDGMFKPDSFWNYLNQYHTS